MFTKCDVDEFVKKRSSSIFVASSPLRHPLVLVLWGYFFHEVCVPALEATPSGRAVPRFAVSYLLVQPLQHEYFGTLLKPRPLSEFGSVWQSLTKLALLFTYLATSKEKTLATLAIATCGFFTA